MLLYDEAITLLKQKHSFISKRWQLQSHAVRPLIFLHVHKAGGTQMCRIARFMGLGLPSQGTTYNCNDKNKGDSCFHSYTPKSLKTCKGRHEYMKANSISFTAIESFLGHEPCELNNYLVTMRHPILRTFSHIVANPPHHMRLNPETVPAFMDLVRSAETSNKTSSLSGDLHTALYRPALFDNFLTRTLLGENAFRLPMRGITRTHFNAARRRLEKMQLVIPASNCTFEVRKCYNSCLACLLTFPICGVTAVLATFCLSCHHIRCDAASLSKSECSARETQESTSCSSAQKLRLQECPPSILSSSDTERII